MTTATTTISNLRAMLSTMVAKAKVGDVNVDRVANSIKDSVDPLAEGNFVGMMNENGELQGRAALLDVKIAARHAYYESLKTAVGFAIDVYGEDAVREILVEVGGGELRNREVQQFINA